MPYSRSTIFITIIFAIMSLMTILPERATGEGGRIPTEIEIGSPAGLFGEVYFDHEMHLDLADTCSECHHHTLGSYVIDEDCARCHRESEPTEEVSCGGCHTADPFSAEYLKNKMEDPNLYHNDKPGLKAAYHLNCVACHREMGAPTGCQDCHERTAAGDSYYRSDAMASGVGGTGKEH